MDRIAMARLLGSILADVFERLARDVRIKAAVTDSALSQKGGGGPVGVSGPPRIRAAREEKRPHGMGMGKEAGTEAPASQQGGSQPSVAGNHADLPHTGRRKPASTGLRLIVVEGGRHRTGSGT